MFENKTKEEAAKEILSSVREFYGKFMVRPEYKEGDRISYASRVFDEKEVCNLVDSALEFWLTSGRYTDEFEKGLGAYLGVSFVSLVNSGSSAKSSDFQAAPKGNIAAQNFPAVFRQNEASLQAARNRYSPAYRSPLSYNRNGCRCTYDHTLSEAFRTARQSDVRNSCPFRSGRYSPVPNLEASGLFYGEADFLYILPRPRPSSCGAADKSLKFRYLPPFPFYRFSH